MARVTSSSWATVCAAARPDEAYSLTRAREMTDFAAALSRREDLTVRMAAVLLLDRLYRLYPDGGRALAAVEAVSCDDSGTLRYLRQDVLAEGEPLLLPEEVVSEIFLDNLKTATPWITKQANLRLLTDFARSGQSPALHIATHLSNLIKVSDRVTVRHSAGNALLALAPRLTADQRNEVAVELCRGLELGQQEFTKYIPDYLGRFALWLPPAELDEVLADLHVNLSSSDSRVTASVLDTVGVIYEEYDAYRSRFPEADEAYRRERLLGLLMRGLSGIDGATRQEALYVLGRRVFGSGELGRHEKRRAFMLTERKLLSAQNEFPGEGLTFYYRAAMLGKLYRFLTEERLSGTRQTTAPSPSASGRGWPSSPAPSTPSPCPTRASSRPSATWAMRCCWPSTSSPGRKRPSPTACGGASPPCPWRTCST